jgi:hypothetical protein
MKRIVIVIGLCLAVNCSIMAEPVQTGAAPASSEVVAHVHWLGKKRIAADTNADGFMKIWNLPETAMLETQTINKLADAPWRLLRNTTNGKATNLLSPILHDLLEQEAYLEIRQPASPANQPGEMVVAVRLDAQRAELWRTNLAAALESLTTMKLTITDSGWSLKKHHVPNFLQLIRAGDWTVLGAAQERNGLFEEVLARIKRTGAPFSASGTNFWLEASVDLPRAAVAVGRHWNLPDSLPKLSLNLTGDGRNVHTSGDINLSREFPIVLEPWNIPTNLMDGPLSSFTAIRGCQPWMPLRIWEEFETNSPPNQLYLWTFDGAPMESYFAAPLTDASNTVSRLSDFVLKKSEPWFSTHELARFQRAKKYNGIEWKGFPFISPCLKSIDAPGGGFILGGFSPPPMPSNQLPPEQVIRINQAPPNSVYYDWELTGARLNQLTFIAQTLRAILGEDQMPPASSGMQWLRAMTQKLGPSATEIVYAGPKKLSFARSSGIPFTAIELQLLVQWLESPEFPAATTFSPLFRQVETN